MMIRKLVLGLLLPYAASTICCASVVPKPEEFPATVTQDIVPAKPVIASKLAKLFKTRITEAAKEGPNFAGHYTVVKWGCGMDSFMFVVVDAITGKIYEPPDTCITLADPGDDDVALPGFTKDNPSFSLKSKLILTVGVKDDMTASSNGRATKIYLFDNSRFKLIYKAPAPRKSSY